VQQRLHRVSAGEEANIIKQLAEPDNKVLTQKFAIDFEVSDLKLLNTVHREWLNDEVCDY
jgi:Ulp1 family protease